MCFQTLLERKLNDQYVLKPRETSTKRATFCAILYHVPASWSWLHLEGCFQTRWRLLLWLQKSQSLMDWWTYWGHHLGTEHKVWVGRCVQVKTDVGLRVLWPLYQFLREVITKKRMAWFDPCLRTVAVRPWYVPLTPNKARWTVMYHVWM